MIALAWAFVATLLLVRLLAKIWATCRRLHRSRVIAESLDAEVRMVACELGMTRLPRVYLTDEVTQPLVWGVFRGDVYLPNGFMADSDQDRRQVVLKHELAHVSRCDAIVNFTQSIAGAVFFFHPLVWWANHKIRHEREKCCDEIVLCNSTTQPRLYCEAIVAVLEQQVKTTNNIPVLAVTGSADNLEDRICTILNPKRVFRRRPTAMMSLCVFLFATVVLPAGISLTAQAQTAAASQNDPAKNEAAKEAEVSGSDAEDAGNWKKGQTLDFRVISSTGEPIPDVDLELQIAGEGIDFQDVKTVNTDTEGRALLRLTDLPPKSVRVYPSKKGYVPLRVYWEGDPHAIMPETITIPMQKGRTIGGVIRDKSGQPIPDAKVWVHYYGPVEGKNPNVRANIDDVTTRSSKQGRWRMDIAPNQIDEKKFRIFFYHPNFVSDHAMHAYVLNSVVASPSIAELLTQSAVSVMQKGQTLVGKVVDESGEPVAGAKIHDRENYWRLIDGPRAVTDENGEFQLRGYDGPGLQQREGGERRLTVQADGFAPELVEIPGADAWRNPFWRNRLGPQLAELAEPPKPIRVELKPAQTASGRVIDTNGRPIEGVAINASWWRGKRRQLHIDSKTDSEGRFELMGLPVDEVKFDFRKSGRFMSAESVPIKPTSNQKNLNVDYTITLRPILKVAGNVIDAETGDPLKDFQVITGLNYEDGRAPHWRRGYGWPEAKIKAGEFEIAFTQDMGWQVRIEADGYMPAESKILRDDDAKDSRFQLQFRLVKAEPLTGSILGPDGKPVLGAKVYMPTQRMNTELQEVTSYEDRPPATTDAEGRFTLPPEVQPFCLVALHESGIAMMTEQEFTSGQEIKLEPWSDKHKSHQIIRRPTDGQYVSFPPRD